MQSKLFDQLSFAGNPFTSLSEIGLELDGDSHLTVDGAVLASALAQDPSAVRELFTGDGMTEGFATALVAEIDAFTETDPNNPKLVGLFKGRDQGYQEQIDGIDAQIERLKARLERREELLVLQFAQLEGLLAGFQAQGNTLLSLQQNSFNQNRN